MESSGAFPASPWSNNRQRALLPRRPSSTFSWGETLGPATSSRGRASSYPRACSRSRATNHGRATDGRRATSNRGTGRVSNIASSNRATSHCRASSQDRASSRRGATSQYGASVRMVVQDNVGEEITDIAEVKEAGESQVEAEKEATIVKPVDSRGNKKKRAKKCTKGKFTDLEETEVPAWSCLDVQENSEQKSVWVAESVKFDPAKKGEVQEPHVSKAEDSETIQIDEDREASQQTNSRIPVKGEGTNVDRNSKQEHNYCVTKSVKSLSKTIKIKQGTPRKLSLSEQKVANQRTFNRSIKLSSTTAGTPYFTCCLCNRYFISRNDAMRHAVSQSQHRSSRGVKEVQCQVCDQRFQGMVALNRHARLQHPYTRTCSKCKVKMKTKNGYMTHIKFCGSPEPKLFSCTRCKFTSNFKKNLNNHMKTHDKIVLNEFSFSPVCKDKKGVNRDSSAMVLESEPNFEALACNDEEIIVAHNSVFVTRLKFNTNLPRPINKKITHEFPFVIGAVSAASGPFLAISGEACAMITNFADKADTVRSELPILKMIILPQVSSLAVMTKLSVTVFSLGDETEARMKIEVDDEDALQDITATDTINGQGVHAKQEVHIVMLHNSGRITVKNCCDDNDVKELEVQGDQLPEGMASKSVHYHKISTSLLVGFQDHICILSINKAVESLLTVSKVKHKGLNPVGWTDLKDNIVLFESSGLTFKMDVTTGEVEAFPARPQSVLAGMCTVNPSEVLMLFQDSSVHLVNCEVSSASSSSVYSSLVAYICVLCGDEFRDAYHHSKHIKMHVVAFSKCDICELSFKDKIYKGRHRTQCFMKCGKCKFQSKYPSKINSHLKSSRCLK